MFNWLDKHLHTWSKWEVTGETDYYEKESGIKYYVETSLVQRRRCQVCGLVEINTQKFRR